MNIRKKILQTAGAGIFLALFAAGAQANLLTNSAFDAQDASSGDIFGSTGWTAFGSAFTTQNEVVANSPNNSLKVFGGGAGASQRFSAAEFETFAGSALVLNSSNDPMLAPGSAFVQMKYYRADGTSTPGTGTLAGEAAGGFDAPGFNIFDGNAITFESAQNQWLVSGVGGVAPDLTAWVDFTVLGLNPAGGASFFDDATFAAVPVPAAVWLFGSGLLGLVGVARRRKS